MIDQNKREQIKAQLKVIWPELAQALENPELHQKLEIEGLEVDSATIQRLSSELGIHISLSPEDGRARFSQLYSETMTNDGRLVKPPRIPKCCFICGHLPCDCLQ